jgi:hypothetical protein
VFLFTFAGGGAPGWAQAMLRRMLPQISHAPILVSDGSLAPQPGSLVDGSQGND